MRITNKRQYTIFLTLLVIIGFLTFADLEGMQYYSYVNYSRDHHDPNPGIREKIAIQSVVYNPAQNSVSIKVQAINGLNITLNGIIIKDTAGYKVTSVQISDTLKGSELTTITAHLNRNLAYGSYTAILTTTRGSSFVSPAFTVP